MKLILWFRPLALVCVLISMLVYLISTMDLMLGVLVLPLTLAGWFLTERIKGFAVPTWLINSVILLTVVYALHRGLTRGIDVELISSFMIWIQVVKMYDRKSARDLAQLITMSVFLLIAAVLTSNTLFVGLLLIPAIMLLVFSSTLFQLYAGVERTAGRVPNAADLARCIVSRNATRSFFATVLFVSIAGTVIAFGVFVLAPRGLASKAFGQWSSPALGSARVTGFSDQVRLGTGGLISESHAIVMDMTVNDRVGNNLGALDRVFYLRGAVLDEYEDGKWTRSDAPTNAAASISLPLDRWFTVGPPSSDRGFSIEQTITMRNASSRREHIFSLWRPHLVKYLQPGRLWASVRSDGVMEHEGNKGRFQYVVRSVIPVAGVATPNSGHSLSDTFAVPGVREHALGVLQEAGINLNDQSIEASPERIASILEQYLQNNFSYTLNILTAPSRRDPVEWFLNDEQQGHCEYFASALAGMSKSLGIQARVVTGFVAAEYIPSTRRYIIRASNAHAWVEIRNSVGIWERYDPTPSTVFDELHKPSLNLAGRLRRWFDSLEYVWASSVVAFDSESQKRLFGSSFFTGDSIGDNPRSEDGSVQSGSIQVFLEASRNGLVVFIVAGILLTGFVMALKLIKKLNPSFSLRSNRNLDHPPFFIEMLSRLTHMGLAKPDAIPPLVHARHIQTQHPDIAQAIRTICNFYYAQRFGMQSLTRDQHAQIRELLDTIHQPYATTRG